VVPTNASDNITCNGVKLEKYRLKRQNHFLRLLKIPLLYTMLVRFWMSAERLLSTSEA
jgi:hypothetical protein